jgi:hypothetical protein
MKMAQSLLVPKKEKADLLFVIESISDVSHYDMMC